MFARGFPNDIGLPRATTGRPYVKNKTVNSCNLLTYSIALLKPSTIVIYRLCAAPTFERGQAPRSGDGGLSHCTSAVS